jgi:ribosomal protein S18 acetylase RimI-like enzyme
MLQQILISRIDQNRAGALSKIASNTFYETFRPYNTEQDIQAYIQKAYKVEIMANQLANTEKYYFAIATVGEEIVGYIKLILNQTHTLLFGQTAELEKIYVIKSHWDKKVGAALMTHAIEICKDLKYNNIFLGVWQENQRAVSFYKKFGFKVFDTRKFELGSRICEDYMMDIQL